MAQSKSGQILSRSYDQLFAEFLPELSLVGLSTVILIYLSWFAVRSSRALTSRKAFLESLLA